ncbi:MAG TPA: 5-oxoprolinase subunit PxpB [Aliidongia sp.]|nr:5-oxoprolinase subunit PxpB [Aliidongia sp.]
MTISPRFLAAGDAALVVEFGTVIDPALIEAVQALDRALAGAALPGVIETVPSFRSLMVHYDPLAIGRDDLIERIGALETGSAASTEPGRRWLLPACYEASFAPDLAHVAEATGLLPDEVVARHQATGFTVAVIGFLPGCPFLSGLGDPFDLPRRQEPRTRVPGGAVAVAQKLSVIYPTESPGGWHLIGNCPLRLFDPAQQRPALLAPGDGVSFRPIDLAEHARIRAAVSAGDYDPRRECVAP